MIRRAASRRRGICNSAVENDDDRTTRDRWGVAVALRHRCRCHCLRYLSPCARSVGALRSYTVVARREYGRTIAVGARRRAPAPAADAGALDRPERGVGFCPRRRRRGAARGLDARGCAVQPDDHRAVPTGVARERDRRSRLPPDRLVSAHLRVGASGRRAAAGTAASQRGGRRTGRAAVAPPRRGRLPRPRLGQRAVGRRARGRADAVRRRHHRRAARRSRRADHRRARGGRSARPDAAARQAVLGARIARDLAQPHDRHLAAGLAGAGRTDPHRGDPLDARRRARQPRPGRVAQRRPGAPAAAARPAQPRWRDPGRRHLRADRAGVRARSRSSPATSRRPPRARNISGHRNTRT